MAQTLMDFGANPNLTGGKVTFTGFHAACYAGFVEMVALFLKHGVDVHHRAPHGPGAMHSPAFHCGSIGLRPDQVKLCDASNRLSLGVAQRRQSLRRGSDQAAARARGRHQPDSEAPRCHDESSERSGPGRLLSRLHHQRRPSPRRAAGIHGPPLGGPQRSDGPRSVPPRELPFEFSQVDSFDQRECDLLQ